MSQIPVNWLKKKQLFLNNSYTVQNMHPIVFLNSQSNNVHQLHKIKIILKENIIHTHPSQTLHARHIWLFLFLWQENLISSYNKFVHQIYCPLSTGPFSQQPEVSFSTWDSSNSKAKRYLEQQIWNIIMQKPFNLNCHKQETIFFFFFFFKDTVASCSSKPICKSRKWLPLKCQITYDPFS